jgi:hypothetical protein
MSREDKEKLQSFIRIVGDCGHPWYVVPTELDDDTLNKPLKCPFCECDGAPVSALVEELKSARRKSRKAGFLERRKRKK